MKKSLLNQDNIQREDISNSLEEQLSQGKIPEEADRQLLNKSFIKKQRYLKLICVAFLLSGFLYYRFIYTITNSTKCILDSFQQYTFEINRKLYAGWDNVVIGIGQVIMDGWIVATTIFWVIKIQNFRIPFALSMFFGVRAIILNIIKFPFPDYLVWHSPGFISLTVPYDHTRDFFYSGHTGSLTIILLQFSQLTVKQSHKCISYIWITTFFSLIYMMNMLIITRVHYTSDVIGGLVFSIYFYWIAGQKTIWADKFMSLPYLCIIQPIIRKYKAKKQLKNGQNSQADDINQKDPILKESFLSLNDQLK